MQNKIEINAKGLICPDPLILLRNAIRKAQSGQIIEIESDDPVSLRDIPAFCSFMGHELIQTPDLKNTFTFILKKK